jgi:hypothetical protein
MLFSTCCVQNEWAVCRVFNKDLLAKNAPQAAPAAGGLEISDPLAFADDYDFLLDITAGLPPLMDSPFGGDDDFTGASSSTSGTALLPEQQDMGYYQVKTEQPAPPPQEIQSPLYFSYPATASGNPGGAGYSLYLAAGNQQGAIRTHSRPQAPSSSALLGAETEMLPSLTPSSRQPSFLDLEELSSDPLLDYSNMWKF